MLDPLLLLAVLTLTDPRPQAGPPGLVHVEGGPAVIGSTVEDVEKLIAQHEDLASSLAGETPRFSADVEGFFLMPTEVTNEQYAEFVRASGAMPPRSFGEAALDSGRAAFLDEQNRAAQAAKEANVPFERSSFDPESWWRDHWREVEWEVPAGELAQPVVFVSYGDAEHYARWAGLRLMSELEFQRAGRGNSPRSYPWGEDWDDERFCRSLHAGRDRTAAVGSYPDGAVHGIHDLAGNVWEWTSSPYEAFPGYKALRVVTGRGKSQRTIEALAGFDPAQRVVVGGSYHTDKLAVRLATRRNSDPGQATNALGFRCAASTTRGLDAARWALEQDVGAQAFGDLHPSPAGAAILERWTSVPGTAGVAGYAVITGHEQLLFCPVEELPASLASDLEAKTREAPLLLGFLSSTRAIAAPALPNGTYLVGWRAAGPLPERRAKVQQDGTNGSWAVVPASAEQLAWHEVPGFDATQDCFVLFDATGAPLIALPAPSSTNGRPKSCSLTLEPAAHPATGASGTALDALHCMLSIPSSTKAKNFFFTLELGVEPGTIDSSWK